MLELIPLRYGVQAEDTTRIDLLVRIVPPKPEVLPERAPLNLSLVLDRSGSMAGVKLQRTLEAARQVIDNLFPGDLLSVVVFDDRVNILIPATDVTDRTALSRILDGVRSGGSTALHAGWLEGGTQTAQNVDPGRLNRVLLLTDGQANVGLVEPDAICSDVNGLAQRGVSTSTLGFGNDYNETLLRSMAAAGNGNHYYVETPEQLTSIFELELGGLMGTVGQNVRLSFEAPGAVQVLTRLEKDEQGRLRLNDMMIDKPLSVLLRIDAPPAAPPQAVVRLDYFDFALKRQVSQTATLNLPSVTRDQWGRLASHALVYQELALWDASEARTAATRALEEENEKEARRLLEEALAGLRQLPANAVVRDHMQQLEEVLRDVREQRHGAARKKAVYQAQSYSKGSLSLADLAEAKEMMRQARELKEKS